MKSKSMLILGALVAAAGAALLYKSSRNESITAGIVGMSVRRRSNLPAFLRSDLSFHDAHDNSGTYYTHGLPTEDFKNPVTVMVTPEAGQDRIYYDGQRVVEGKRVVATPRS